MIAPFRTSALLLRLSLRASGNQLGLMLAGGFLVAGLLFLSGCGSQDSGQASNDSTNESHDDANADEDNGDDAEGGIQSRPLITERSFGGGDGSSGGGSRRRTSLGGSQAIERIGVALEESLELSPVTIIWLFDVTSNAQTFIEPLKDEVGRLYDSLPEESAGVDLESGVATFADDIEILTENATADVNQIKESLDGIEFSDQETQNTFGAIDSAIGHFVTSSTARSRRVMFVCLTNESGDDRDQLEAAAAGLQKYNIPLYVVGIPAPFGRVGNESSRSMMRREAPSEGRIQVGPETCGLERINLAFPPSSDQAYWIDSGFGSWGLERLARLNGGRFLLVRDFDFGFSGGLEGGEWPRRSARRFSEDVMLKYKPDYSSEAEYLASIESSPLRKALVDAAKMPHAEALASMTLEFDARDTARLVNQLGQAQREPARVLPRIDAIRNVLQRGEAGRATETDPRWLASYDLAMGRVLAAYARADGYNSFLAELKRGRSFSDSANDSWGIESSKVFEEGGSSLRTMSQKAVDYLERVIEEHPGTPWAFLAEQELSQDIGLKIVEMDRYDE